MIDTLVETIITTYKFDDGVSKLLKDTQLKSEIELLKEKWKKVKVEGNYILTFYKIIIFIL